MKEKNLTTPFRYGVSLRYTCFAGLWGNLKLIIPDSVGTREKNLHILNAQRACLRCNLRKIYCSGIDIENRMASFDGYNEKVKHCLKRQKAPCSKKVKVIK